MDNADGACLRHRCGGMDVYPFSSTFENWQSEFRQLPDLGDAAQLTSALRVRVVPRLGVEKIAHLTRPVEGVPARVCAPLRASYQPATVGEPSRHIARQRSAIAVLEEQALVRISELAPPLVQGIPHTTTVMLQACTGPARPNTR
jgi:hypothetical protein